MATAAEPTDCSQRPRSAGQGRRWWGRTPRALRPQTYGQRRQKPRPRAAGSRDVDCRYRELRQRGATGQRRHFVTAGRAVRASLLMVAANTTSEDADRWCSAHPTLR
ncbi:hypothetical protein P7K49_033467 [Saguinus oedipus]|uniref:Uncharacterized protein n=1 Tax=Saguinus oedipus TaxID=9490 RepID=A0ABQ9TRZ6_SAGOE|nr:hypothetical protein P7K49_033467 [Saguinus oedipus]